MMTERVFHVQDFGATTDDSTDDSAAIQAAIQAAHEAYLADPSGGQVTVQLSAGTYIVSGDRDNPSAGGVELLSGVSLVGAGMGESILQLADNFDSRINGIVRTALETVSEVTIADLTIDGNRANNTGHQAGFICGIKEDGSGRVQSNITLSRVEIKDCTAYGFNPHEISYNVLIEDSIAHGNGLDGFVADAVIGGTYRNNISYNNDRHGFNIQNATKELFLIDNLAYDNGYNSSGGAGIVVQRGNVYPKGSEVIPWVSDIHIIGGEYYGNSKEGILVKLSDNVAIDGASVHDNMRQGIRIEGSSDTTVQNSDVFNNSQEAHSSYDEIQIRLRYDNVTSNIYFSTNTNVVDNTIYSDGEIRARYGIREEASNADPDPSGSYIFGNTVYGAVSGDISALHYVWYGTAEDDFIAGTTSGEEMRGLQGSDDYIVNHSQDLVVELPSEGNDTVHSEITYYLPDHIENLMLTGSESKNGHGNILNNIISGNSSANTLKGYEGDDTLEGGLGIDALYGGAGNDVFLLRKGEFGGDVVKDFEGNGANVGDFLKFSGFSNTATLNYTGNGTWTVVDGAYEESFQIVGVNALDAEDHNLSEPEPLPPTAFPAISLGTTQAEKLELAIFTIANIKVAEGGQVIENRQKGVPGSAKGTFIDESGTYNMQIAYFDENDGTSPISVAINGQIVHSWVADKDLGSSVADQSTFVVEEFAVALEQYDMIEIFGTRDGNELVRIDYVGLDPWFGV